MSDQKKIIEVEVREKGIDELNRDLKQNEQQLKDNGGAIAILDELTGGLATKFRDAAEASKLFGNVTKTALIATGIGAFAVVLGTVVAYWEEIVGFVTGVDQSLEGVVNKQKQIVELLDAEMDLIEERIKAADILGENADDLLKTRKEILQTQLDEIELQKIAITNQLLEETQDAKRLGFFEYLLGIKAQITDEEREQLNLLDISLLTLEQRATQIQSRLDNMGANGRDPGEGPEADGTLGPIPDQITNETIGVVTGLNLGTLREVIDIEQGLIFEAMKSEERERIAKSKRDRALAEEDAEHRLEMLRTVATGLAGFSALAGQQTGVGKALAVANASINTGVAVTEALKAPGIPNALRIAQAVAIGAFGLAQVKDILSVQVPDGTLQSPLIRGGASAGTAPAIQQPSFNIVGDPGINQLQDTISQQTNEPIRAYVVSDDVRTQNELDRNIRASASL